MTGTVKCFETVFFMRYVMEMNMSDECNMFLWILLSSQPVVVAMSQLLYSVRCRPDMMVPGCSSETIIARRENFHKVEA